MKCRYGFLGFFSLIGLLGFWTDNPMFFPFLGFALFFEYFFVETDEMVVQNMRKAAAWAFFSELVITAIVTFYYAIIEHNSNVALVKGIGLGFGFSIIVFCFVTAYFDWKDRCGVSDD